MKRLDTHGTAKPEEPKAAKLQELTQVGGHAGLCGGWHPVHKHECV